MQQNKVNISKELLKILICVILNGKRKDSRNMRKRNPAQQNTFLMEQPFPGQVYTNQLVPLAIADSTDHCILTAGKVPRCQKTIAQQEGFPHPRRLCR